MWGRFGAVHGGSMSGSTGGRTNEEDEFWNAIYGPKMSEEKEYKPRSYAVDDVEAIARHIKRIREEESGLVPPHDLPSDVEATSFSDMIAATLRGEGVPCIYSEEFWSALIRDGVVTFVAQEPLWISSLDDAERMIADGRLKVMGEA